jgi:hypothetical protein
VDAGHLGSDDFVEPLTNAALPAGNCGNVGLHRRITIGFGNLRIATCEKLGLCFRL